MLFLVAVLVLSARAAIEGYTVLFVPDGDGFKAREQSTQETFLTRLCGIDCPEKGQRGKESAKKRLEALLKADVRLVKHGYDVHERTLVSLVFQQKPREKEPSEQDARDETTGMFARRMGITMPTVSAQLVDEGLCFVYRQYLHNCGKEEQQALLAAERNAYTHKRNLYANPTHRRQIESFWTPEFWAPESESKTDNAQDKQAQESPLLSCAVSDRGQEFPQEQQEQRVLSAPTAMQLRQQHRAEQRQQRFAQRPVRASLSLSQRVSLSPCVDSTRREQRHSIEADADDANASAPARVRLFVPHTRTSGLRARERARREELDTQPEQRDPEQKQDFLGIGSNKSQSIVDNCKHNKGRNEQESHATISHCCVGVRRVPQDRVRISTSDTTLFSNTSARHEQEAAFERLLPWEYRRACERRTGAPFFDAMFSDSK